MPEMSPSDASDGVRTQGSKALRLARYLRGFVGLRTTIARDVDGYDSVLWFGDLPREPECESPAWDDTLESDAPWLEVRKQQFPKCPEPPEIILPWVDRKALNKATVEVPPLRALAMLSHAKPPVEETGEPPLVEHRLVDHPEVSRAYERYRQVWAPWAAEYRRRERVQNVYADLFRMYTQVRKEGEIVELVLGLGLLDWRSVGPIRRHIVTARVDLHFDPASGTIRLDGAADGVQLRIEDDMLDPDRRPERSRYEAVGEQLSEIGDAVWDRARVHAALTSWATALHPDSQWSAGLKPETDANGRPMVSFAPALILRKRAQRGMARIYDQLIARLSEDECDAPPGWAALLDDRDDRIGEDAAESSIRETHRSLVDSHEVYFPLAANQEQRRIVEAIANRRGVLVQGPPGTGKSHTIANLVCHLLATGKRVLITAETARALRVLKKKLPPELQPLCVSLLGQGGDEFAELNTAVQEITRRHAVYAPGAYDHLLALADNELDHHRRSLAACDIELQSLRADETLSHTIGSGAYQGTASAIAHRVAVERDRFGWLRLPDHAPDNPPIDRHVMIDWLRIRRSHSDELTVDLGRAAVPSKHLLSPVNFADAVAGEHDASSEVARIAQLKRHAAYEPIAALDPAARAELGRKLRGLEGHRRRLSRYDYTWLADCLAESLAGRHARWRALLQRSRDLISQIERLLPRVRSFIVSIPSDRAPSAIRADAAVLIEHLKAGGKWARWRVFAPDVVKGRVYLRNQVTIGGQCADTPERLLDLCDYLDVDLAFEALNATWTDHGGLPRGKDLHVRLASVKEQVDILEGAIAFAQTCRTQGREMAATTLPIPEPDWMAGEAQEWLAIIEASDVDARCRRASERVTACLREVRSTQSLHNAHSINAALAAAIEQRDVTAYSREHAELVRMETLRTEQRLRHDAETTLKSALPGMVEAVGASLHDPAWDARLSRWNEAWHWAIADRWLQRRNSHAYQHDLWRRRSDTAKAIAELVARAASLRAWICFFNRLSTKETAALKSWREAVKAMGKGTGRSAKLERLRAEARKYMEQCREAIPVWIMPRYLVAEMVDPTPERYDFVIVDEASQLGIESLFLFYIAKKMVVVGDDQQISPYGVGIADENIAGLQRHFLDGIPHQHALSAQSSLYANAKIRFGQSIVLREHFRCMPEIIQFSNDLCYASNGTPLDPLRAFPANRLQPLVVRHVPEGYRSGTTQNALNEAEADAVVAQIVACINDPRYVGLTMGVISLQGEAQAKLIEHKLLASLEPEVIEARRLICGDAYAFQGDERHIVFLSMVAASNQRIGALSGEAARQRFNVAASRAQDQLWLFHSATLDALSTSCMRHHLLSYMLDPRRATAEESEQRFESPFERDVYRSVTARGFHVRTQVCVGDPANHRYRIDLVVEGMRGRLAVECDGDQWHGPERYEQDMARQRDLERSGWQFVRIRGGEFYRDPDAALAPLWEELARLGIAPGGIDESASEPPPPADIGRTADLSEDDDAVDPHDPAAEADVTPGTPELAPTDRGDEKRRWEPEPSNAPELWARPLSPLLPEYLVFQGVAGDDPRTVSAGAVAEGLARIIEVEGPMIARRAYAVYLRNCGIRRMGHELRSAMNKALASAIRQGRVVAEDEFGKRGLFHSVVRLNGHPPVRPRRRGPREFTEIPPSELQAVARQLTQARDVVSGSDAHLRATLECFDLKRLTTQTGSALLEALERVYPYVDEYLRGISEERT